MENLAKKKYNTTAREEAEDRLKLLDLIYKYTYQPSGVTRNKKGFVQKAPVSHIGMARSIIKEITKGQPTPVPVSNETWLYFESALIDLKRKYKFLSIKSIWENLPRWIETETSFGQWQLHHICREKKLFLVDENRYINNDGVQAELKVEEGHIRDIISGFVYTLSSIKVLSKEEKEE